MTLSSADRPPFLERGLACAACAIVIASLRLAAIDLDVDDDDILRAMQLARSLEAERQRFHEPYVFAPGGPDVDRLEIITEYRRLVLIGEDSVRHGNVLFTHGVREASAALAPFRHRLSIVATVRLHPLNTYITPPPIEIVIEAGGRAIAPIDGHVDPQLGFTKGGGKDSRPILGATAEIVFDPAEIGQRTLPVVVSIDGRVATRQSVPFGALP
jgi:hypothetical protein